MTTLIIPERLAGRLSALQGAPLSGSTYDDVDRWMRKSLGLAVIVTWLYGRYVACINEGETPVQVAMIQCGQDYDAACETGINKALDILEERASKMRQEPSRDRYIP